MRSLRRKAIQAGVYYGLRGAKKFHATTKNRKVGYLRGTNKSDQENKVEKRDVLVPYNSLSKVGHRAGRGTSKRHVAYQATATILPAALYQQDLTTMPATNFNDIDQRQRNLINIVGFALNMELVNLTKENMVVNYGIITPRGKNTNPTGSLFLRGSSSQSFRGTDLADTQASIVNNYEPINSDKFIVLHHKRLHLAAGQEYYSSVPVAFNETQHSTATVREWIPIGRQFRFDGDTGTTCDTPLYLVWWYDYVGRGSAETPTTDGLKYTIRAINYFKEPAGGY